MEFRALPVSVLVSTIFSVFLERFKNMPVGRHTGYANLPLGVKEYVNKCVNEVLQLAGVQPGVNFLTLCFQDIL